MAEADYGQWGPEPFLRRGGRPITVATISVYLPNGLTLATLAADQDGTALSNPLPVGVAPGSPGLDTLGNALFFAAPGAYVMAVVMGGTEVYRSPITVDLDTDSALFMREGALLLTDPRCGGVGNDSTDNYAAFEAARILLTTSGGTLLCPPGVYRVTPQVHFLDPGVFSGVWLTKGMKLTGPGATIKLAPNTLGASPNEVWVVRNRNIGSPAEAEDLDLVIEDITVDGNAANQTGQHGGINLTRLRRARLNRVTVRNCRGTSGMGYGERFHIELLGCEDVVLTDCNVEGTAGSTASGFSADACTNIKWFGCHANGMSVAHGFTHNNCRNVDYFGCTSRDNTGFGFNSEVSFRVGFHRCTTGGLAVTSGISNPVIPDGQELGNGGHGFTINATEAFSFVDCISEYNGATGLYVDNTSSGLIDGGTFRNNTEYGIYLNGTNEKRVVFGATPNVAGNEFVYGYNFATAGAIVSIPSTLGGAQVPDVPASNAWAKNTLPFPIMISIVGGTISDVYVAYGANDTDPPGGGQVSRGEQRLVYLAPQKWIAITYSSAPTWVWEVVA